MTWQNSVLQQQKDQKSQLHHAIKPQSSKVIDHFPENDVITYDVIAPKMASDPPFLFLIFEVQAIVYQLSKNFWKILSVGT